MPSEVLNLIHLVSIIALIYSIGWLLVRGNRNTLTFSFIFCEITMVFWCASQITNIIALNTDQLLLSYKIGYLGICFSSPSWLIFSILYCGKKLKIKDVLLIYIVPVFHYIMMFTDKYHHLFYKVYEMGNIKYGCLFYSNTISTYLFTIISIIFILRKYIGDKQSKKQNIALSLSVAIPIIVNILYLLGVLAISFDITPAAFSLSAIIIVFTLYKYNFLNINSIVFEKSLRNIVEGIIIYDKSGVITYTNVAVNKFFLLSESDNISKVYKIIKEYDEDFCKSNENYSESLLTLEDGKTINIKKYNHYGNEKKKEIVATTLIITDISRYYDLINKTWELALSNQQLAIEKERNRIAQAVHDTTGHTLTMIQSLTKLAQIEYTQGNDENLLEYLNEAKKLSSNGIKELRYSINNLKQKGRYELLSEQINYLIKGGLMSIFWTQKVKLFYAVLLANNSHCSGVM